MHEQHLLDDLIEKIRAVAAAEGARSIAAVEVWLGALSHFSEEHFREHFGDAVRGTALANVRLAVTLSTDIHDTNANGIVLRNVVVEQ